MFRADFVVVDPASDATDNNAGADFRLPLLGAPSESEVAARRQAALKAAERERLAVHAPPQPLIGSLSAQGDLPG